MDDDIIGLEKDYAKMFHVFKDANIDFDYGDEGIIKSIGKVEIIDKKPYFVIGLAKYTSIVIPSMTTIRKTSLDLIEEFIDLGGNVIFAGKIFDYVDCQKSEKANRLLEKCESFSLDDENLITKIKKLSKSIIDISYIDK